VIIDHRLLFNQLDGIHRAVAHTISATGAFVRIDLHSLYPTAFSRDTFCYLIDWSAGVKSIADFRLQIEISNTARIQNPKSAICIPKS
jgi:hypothetical protein